MEETEVPIRIRDKRSGVFTVDNVVLNHYGLALGATGIATYVTLCRYANNQSQECYPSIATIQRETGMRPETVIDCLNRLERLRLVKRERSQGRVSTYVLLEPVADGEEKERVLRDYYEWMATITKKRSGTRVNALINEKVTTTKKRSGRETVTKKRSGTITEKRIGPLRKSVVPYIGIERTYLTNLENELTKTGVEEDARPWLALWRETMGYPITTYQEKEEELAGHLATVHGPDKVREALILALHAKGNRFYRNARVKEIRNFSRLLYNWDAVQDYKVSEYLTQSAKRTPAGVDESFFSR